jgi:hypothetical protein
MFGLSAPQNIKHVYGDWIQNMNKTNKRLLFVRLDTMFWSVWLSRNDIVFNKTQSHLICRLCSGRRTGQEHGRHSKRKRAK